VFSVLGLQTKPDGAAYLHLRQIAKVNRPAVPALHDDRVQVLDAGCEAHRTHDELLLILFEVLGADIEVVGLNPFNDLGEGQIVAQQGCGMHHHLVLLFEAADSEHFGDSRYGLQVEFCSPILHGAQFFQGVLAGGVFEVIEQDQSHAGGDGPHGGLAETFGDLILGLLQTFVDHLAAEVDVHSIFEIDVHHRQAEVGDRPDLRHARQPDHARFDGKADVFFNLLGRQAFGDGEHLHKVRRDVWKRLHGQLPVAEPSAGRDQHGQHHHQQAVIESEINQALGHGAIPPG
jgi:hypothetical protein